MKETDADVFCQSERADRIDRVAYAMRKEYVSDFQVVIKQGRRVTHGPILRSFKVNHCPRCNREYTYNELQEAKEAGQFSKEGDLACECGCTFLVDWQFKGKESVYQWTRPTVEEEAERRVEAARAICSRE
jgi:hypothetical protein